MPERGRRTVPGTIEAARDALNTGAGINREVHQGNGTAAIFANDPHVFTFSMHGTRNYPFARECSRLDVGLEDECDAEGFLSLLDRHLDPVLDEARPDLVIYIAGADPYSGDRLGRLSLSFEGLIRRDAMVFSACRRRGLPVARILGGGYAADLADAVAIHSNTVVALQAHHA